MHNVVIVGIGNLGIRHFQAILNCKENLNIYLVDPLEESLKRAREMVVSNKHLHNHNIYMIETIENLPNEIDVAIISTSSNVRSKVIRELLSDDRNLKYLILEKVLFQTVEEYTEIGELIVKRDVKAWVNCPRRMLDGYKEIKKRLEKDSIQDVVITGGDWGLGCNSIHMIDLIGFLIGDISTLVINSDMIDPKIIGSKRDGYYEFTGSLFGKVNDDITFIITSNANSSEPVTMYFTCKDNKIIIEESRNVARIICNDIFEEIEINTKYQSELTDKVVEKLIRDGNCELTPFDISSKMHLPLIKAFLNHQQKYANRNDEICRIT